MLRTGVWLVGARGSVAVTTLVGVLATRSGLAEPTGCVTELPELRHEALPALTDLVLGGHDISSIPLVKKAHDLVESGVLPAAIVEAVAAELHEIEADLRPGTSSIEQVTADLTEFRLRHGLDRVVVINVSSTEPMGDGVQMPASSRYACGAFAAGCSFVDLTPSLGARHPEAARLAIQNGLPYAGNDGKTGETLLKSVLAPMFAMRNLSVRSWSGTNLLGGGDGANLAQPGANAAKVASKQRVLKEILGYVPEGNSRIDYVPDIGDFKTAWDLITFAGFLGIRMRLEFTWHGCDSALAAPLVIDLARLTAAAHRLGFSGPLTQLAFFFKDPLGLVPHALPDQWRLLCDWVSGWVDETA